MSSKAAMFACAGCVCHTTPGGIITRHYCVSGGFWGCAMEQLLTTSPKHNPEPQNPEKNVTGLGVSNLRPVGFMLPRMAMNVAQCKLINLHKTFFSSLVFISVCVYLI